MNTLKRIRIEKAKKMLENKVILVEQIAALCGFESPSYFIKIFKKETGLTPLEYRKAGKFM